mmetsp:Transcript_31758/g.51587  ORF Transcript_31758/g.51587 Transcript_31758/m.51587 type:complete len:551 (+) Transcript_31758:244-1896(+)
MYLVSKRPGEKTTRFQQAMNNNQSRIGTKSSGKNDQRTRMYTSFSEGSISLLKQKHSRPPPGTQWRNNENKSSEDVDLLSSSLLSSNKMTLNVNNMNKQSLSRPLRLSAMFSPDKNDTTVEGGVVEPKQELSRSWIVSNDGNVPWPHGMRFACTGGNFYGFRDFSVAPIQPGEKIRLNIMLHAPASPGSYIAHFCFLHEGVPIGPSQRVRFVVKQQRWNNSRAQNSGQKLQVGAHFVRDLTIMDGQMVTPGQEVGKTWLIKNTGKIPWPKGTRLVCIGGNWPVGDVSVLVEDVLPSMETPVSVTLKAPNEMGRQSARFQLQLANGRRFGHRYWVNIQVSHFPSAEQLYEMGRQFLLDNQLVQSIQGEIPFIFGSLSQGRPLLRTAEDLVKKCPKLKSHPFVLFIWRFLPTIDHWLRSKLKDALETYTKIVRENNENIISSSSPSGSVTGGEEVASKISNISQPGFSHAKFSNPESREHRRGNSMPSLLRRPTLSLGTAKEEKKKHIPQRPSRLSTSLDWRSRFSQRPLSTLGPIRIFCIHPLEFNNTLIR